MTGVIWSAGWVKQLYVVENPLKTNKIGL